MAPTEGGHTDASFRGWKQRALVAAVAAKEGFCEMEHLLSGAGLVRIYDFLRSDPAVGRVAPLLDAPGVSKGALDGSNPVRRPPHPTHTFASPILGEDEPPSSPGDASLRSAAPRLRPVRSIGPQAAREAVDIFLEMLGAEAGNLALKTLARGGVYIAGGIPPKLKSRITGSTALLDGFLHRASRFSALLASVPLTVVLDEQVGLLGSREVALRAMREERRRRLPPSLSESDEAEEELHL